VARRNAGSYSPDGSGILLQNEVAQKIKRTAGRVLGEVIVLLLLI